MYILRRLMIVCIRTPPPLLCQRMVTGMLRHNNVYVQLLVFFGKL